MAPRSLNIDDCVKQGKAMWCFLAAYLTVVVHKNPNNRFIRLLKKQYSLTSQSNRVFMQSVKSAVYPQRKRSVGRSTGFKLDEIRLLNKVYKLDAPLSDKISFSLENVQGNTLMEKCYNFFDSPTYDNKYVILKFKQPPHFCVLHMIDRSYGIRYYDPRETANRSFHDVICEDTDKINNHDLGPLAYCYTV